MMLWVVVYIGWVCYYSVRKLLRVIFMSGDYLCVFTAKISIVLEESDESLFWLELLEEELTIADQQKLKELKKEADELTSIFASTRKRMQSESRKS